VINRPILGILLKSFFVAYFTALVVGVFVVLGEKEALGSDFVSFLTGASIISAGKGREIYNIESQYAFQQALIAPHHENSVLPYRNTPVMALFFVPFLLFNFVIAYKIYVLLLIFILCIFIFYLTKHFGDVDAHTIWPYLALTFYPLTISIFVGQTSLFLIVVFFMVYWNLRKKNDFVAGILSGTLLIKLQYILFLPFLFVLSRKRSDFLKGNAISLISTFFISLLLAGGHSLLSYPNFLLNTETVGFGSRPESMLTFFSFLRGTTFFGGLDLLSLLGINFFIYGVLFIVFYKYHKALSLALAFSLIIPLVLPFTIHVVNHDLSMLLVPIIIITTTIRSLCNEKLKLLVVVLLFLVPLLETIDIGNFVWAVMIVIGCLLLVSKKVFKLV
jgi:hypothetical protein